MKRILLILSALLLAGLVCISCTDTLGSNYDTKGDDTDTTVEDTTDDTTDETTEETTEDTTEETTEEETTEVPADTASSGGGQSTGGGGGSVISGGGGSMISGGGSNGGSSSPATGQGAVPYNASCKGAYEARITTSTGKSLVHTYSDCSVGGEDNSNAYSYMSMKSTTVSTDPKAEYNSPKVLQGDIKPGLSSDGVLVGYDGYMFYKDTISDFTGQGFLHDEVYNRSVRMLKKRNDWAQANGKKFYFVIAPNKNTVYPDYMPEGYKMADYRRYDQFVALLKAAGITAIDLRGAMGAAVNACPERNLYYKFDTHWNNHAGYIAYETTMNMIRRDFPNAVLHSRSEYQINYCETYMKDEAYYLGQYDYFKDYGPVYTLKTYNGARLVDYVAREGWGQFAFAYEETSGANRGYCDKLYWFKYQNDANSSAPNLYVMRDSYSIAMTAFLKDSFYKSTYNWTFAFDEAEIEKAEADVILVIVSERNLRSYVNNKPVVD